MADYGKFSQSEPFRALLAEFVVEEGNDADRRLYIVHDGCGAEVVQICEPDDMNVLVQAAIDHDCGATE